MQVYLKLYYLHISKYKNIIQFFIALLLNIYINSII